MVSEDVCQNKPVREGWLIAVIWQLWHCWRGWFVLLTAFLHFLCHNIRILKTFPSLLTDPGWFKKKNSHDLRMANKQMENQLQHDAFLTPSTWCFLVSHLKMIFCQICCEPFHSFCLLPEERPRENNKENWCCRRCKFCHVCGRRSKNTKVFSRGVFLQLLYLPSPSTPVEC